MNIFAQAFCGSFISTFVFYLIAGFITLKMQDKDKKD